MTETHTRSANAFNAVLETQGALKAIGYLNFGVTHRFTAAYRLDGTTLRNVLLHDKAGEICPDFLSIVPFTDSFCQFVLRDGVFITNDSAKDSRLNGHKYQGVMASYTGVPLMDNYGELWGTLCHFDVDPYGVSDEEFDLLQRAARRLPPYLAG